MTNKFDMKKTISQSIKIAGAEIYHSFPWETFWSQKVEVRSYLTLESDEKVKYTT